MFTKTEKVVKPRMVFGLQCFSFLLRPRGPDPFTAIQLGLFTLISHSNRPYQSIPALDV